MVRLFSECSAGMRWVSKNLMKSCVLGLAICAATQERTYAAEQGVKSMKDIEATLSENVILGQELLLEGDRFYSDKKYDLATESYGKALGLIPNVPVSKELRAAVSERFAQAAVEQSVAMARFGQYAEAKALLNKALAKNVAPNHAGAKAMLQKLDDPIRYNPALTVEHTRDAESAGKWLRKAEGYLNLGKFDDAHLAYEEVLRIDPQNTAARRGMERVSLEVSNYAKAARDHGRSEALRQVDEAWELKVNPQVEKNFGGEQLEQGEDRIQEVYANSLRQIILPVVDFQEVGIDEAYETIRAWARQYDTSTLNPDEKGMNFVLNLGDRTSDASKAILAKRINLTLKNVPLIQVLDYVSQATGTQWRANDYAVEVTPAGAADGTIYRRTFRVPPSFMQDAVAKSADDSDPFSTSGSEDSSLKKRVSTKEFLSQLGVTFPEGAAAKYIPSTGSLTVSNTRHNMDLIEEYVSTYSRGEEVQVVMKVTIVDIEETDLKELGFDWLLGTSSRNVTGGGGSQGNGSEVTGLASGSGTLTDGAPVTSGLRSGDGLYESNALGQLLGGRLGGDNRAPGILTLTTPDFQAILRGLNQKKSLSRLDVATIVARSGEKATLYNGQQFIYPTEYEPPELPNSTGSNNGGSFPVTPATPTAFEERLVGLSLEAEATVSENKHYVDLKIDPKLVEFDGFVNYGSPIQSSSTNQLTGNTVPIVITDNAILQPVFRVVNLNGGAVTIQDGANFVIAGLNKSNVETVEDKVPILGDVPLVGKLFRSEGIQTTNRALMIFVNVELRDPTGKPVRNR